MTTHREHLERLQRLIYKRTDRELVTTTLHTDDGDLRLEVKGQDVPATVRVVDRTRPDGSTQAIYTVQLWGDPPTRCTPTDFINLAATVVIDIVRPAVIVGSFS